MLAKILDIVAHYNRRINDLLLLRLSFFWIKYFNIKLIPSLIKPNQSWQNQGKSEKVLSSFHKTVPLCVHMFVTRSRTEWSNFACCRYYEMCCKVIKNFHRHFHVHVCCQFSNWCPSSPFPSLPPPSPPPSCTHHHDLTVAKWPIFCYATIIGTIQATSMYILLCQYQL